MAQSEKICNYDLMLCQIAFSEEEVVVETPRFKEYFKSAVKDGDYLIL